MKKVKERHVVCVVKVHRKNLTFHLSSTSTDIHMKGRNDYESVIRTLRHVNMGEISLTIIDNLTRAHLASQSERWEFQS